MNRLFNDRYNSVSGDGYRSKTFLITARWLDSVKIKGKISSKQLKILGGGMLVGSYISDYQREKVEDILIKSYCKK